MISHTNLRLFLEFLDGLKQVKVLAPRHRVSSELCIMGLLEGKEDLRDLLEQAKIDHYIISSGELFRPSFTAFERTPREIVEDLEKVFQMADEIQLKILRDEELTDDEKFFTAPVLLHVCASSVQTSDDFLKGIKAWFDAKKKVKAAVAGS